MQCPTCKNELVQCYSRDGSRDEDAAWCEHCNLIWTSDDFAPDFDSLAKDDNEE